LVGTYKNQDAAKTFSINSMSYMNYPSEFNGNINGKTKQKIIDFINKSQ
jgi:hypothetical protein